MRKHILLFLMACAFLSMGFFLLDLFSNENTAQLNPAKRQSNSQVVVGEDVFEAKVEIKSEIAEKGLADQMSQLQRRLEAESSSRGANVDRPVITDPEGEFSLSPVLIRYFDYFWSLKSEFSHQQLLALFYQDLESNFPPKFHPLIEDLFLRYLQFKQAFAEHLSELSEQDVAFYQLSASGFHEIKRDTLMEYFSLEEIELMFDAQQAALSEPSSAHDFQGQYQSYQEDKSRSKAIELYGEAAADRLNALENKRELWREKLADYALLRDAIVASQGLSERDKQAQIESLKRRLFSSTEQLRVNALERGGSL